MNEATGTQFWTARILSLGESGERNAPFLTK